MDPDNPRPRLCYGLEFLRFSVLLWWVSCITPVLVAYGQPGSLDRTFYPGSATDGPVYAIAKQQDGKLLIAGDFSIADSEVRGRVARLNADGSLDRNFGAGMQGANNWVRTVAIQADGKVLIGGDFTSINNVVRSYIARLNHDGSLDTNFTTAASAPVYSIALQNDNKILIGGRFFLVNNTNRNCAARLNENGTLDTSFTNLSPIAFGSPIVHSIAVQSNGKILIGGAFTNIAGLARANVARLESSGVPDSSFGTTNQGPNSPVYSLAIQSDGRVFISGTFSAVNGTNRSGLARLNNDGSLDTGFVPALYNPYPAVTRITLTTNGQILTCGSTVWQSSTKWGITRLNNNGSLDTTFAGGFIPIDECRTILVQSDGSLIAGGGIAAASVEAGRLEVQGFIRHGVARINTDGSVDESFNSRRIGPRYHISSVAVQHDGKVLVNVGPPLPGNAVLGLPRLNLDGSLDSSFPSASLPPPRDFAVRNDGRIVIGGSFYLNRGGSIWQRIAQLLPDGSVDTNFDQGNFLYNSVERVALAPDGKIYITADSSPVILRLNENGSLDTSFNNVSVYGIDCLAVQPDNKVIVGGFFYTSSTNAPDHIARLNSDGSLDTNFAWNLSGASGYVNCVALQKDGKVLIGGDFTYFQVLR